ncbi:MAG: DUF4783 domain-containing protein [Bacteroidales bacterium]|nr:DUF4783 domain-containing protein [Bacteroidales bacterium]
MRSLLYILMIQAFIFAGVSHPLSAQEVTDQVNKALKAGDATSLGKLFNSSLDISIPGTDESMSKSQATQVMKSFFKENPPKSYSENHQGSSREATMYIIGTYKSVKTFKTYILLKEKEGKYLIVQLQFEEE